MNRRNRTHPTYAAWARSIPWLLLVSIGTPTTYHPHPGDPFCQVVATL